MQPAMQLSPAKLEIRQVVQELKTQYERVSGRKIKYPIEDPGHIFSALFGLDVIYDDQGILNSMGEPLIGCLFPDGEVCHPWRRDKLIVVNMTPMGKKRGLFDPTVHSDSHTISHEGFHYCLHFLRSVGGIQYRKPTYCRTRSGESFMEWQVDFAGGELLMDHDEVAWLLDGKRPPEFVEVEPYRRSFQEHFKAGPSRMEARLAALGYRLLGAKYKWADYSSRVGQNREARSKESQQRGKDHAEYEAKMKAAMESLATQAVMWRAQEAIRRLDSLRKNPNTPPGREGLFGDIPDFFAGLEGMRDVFGGLDEVFKNTDPFGVFSQPPKKPKDTP